MMIYFKYFFVFFIFTFNQLSASNETTIEKLYDKNLYFSKYNEPIILIGIGEEESEVNLKALKDFKIKETEIKKGDSLKVKFKAKSKGKHNNWLILDKFPYEGEIKFKDYDKFIKSYKTKSTQIKTITVGNLSVISGNVIDIRKKLVVFGPINDEKKLEELKLKLYLQLKLKTEVYSELESYPSGEIFVYHNDKEIDSGQNVYKMLGEDIQFININYGYESKIKHTINFEGNIYFSINFNGKISITNEVEIEILLKGIVPSEIYASAHLEALKAQTIAARTDILSKIGSRHFLDPYYICSNVHCQAYKGKMNEHERTNQAIKETQGEVLIDNEGIIDAFYSANSGGHTENNENVWLSRASISLRGRDDFIDWENSGKFIVGINEKNIKDFIDNPPKTYSAVSSFSKPSVFRWKQNYTKKDIQKFTDKYIEKYNLSKKCKFKDLIHKGRGISGRIVALQIVCVNKSDNLTIYGELEIRKYLGFLKSSMFYMNKKYNKKKEIESIEFVGGGWGHGVGMCQTGAIGMAESEKDYTYILKHYYTGANLLKLFIINKDEIPKQDK